MSISELNEVKSINFNGISIMNCPLPELKDICSQSLRRLDDHQQLAGDLKNLEALDYFTDAYDELDIAYQHLDEGGVLSLRSRNEMRLIIKGAEKLAATLK